MSLGVRSRNYVNLYSSGSRTREKRQILSQTFRLELAERLGVLFFKL